MTLFDDLTDDPTGDVADDDAGDLTNEVRTPESAVPMERVMMTLAYDGAPFHGFASNPGVDTVAGTLTKAIERVLRHPVAITCAGRTDKGVHARGQVISFDAPSEGLDPERLQHAINAICAPAIVVHEAAIVDSAFDARFSARSRLYRYTVLARDLPDPFLANTAWWVGKPLNVKAMRLAVSPLIGEHDFSSFCRRPKNPKQADVPPTTPGPGSSHDVDGEQFSDRGHSLVRRVLDASWSEGEDGLLYFDIEATAFCHQMVRSITGTLVDVGLGRLRAGDVSGILRARDRSVAGTVAPPHGLCLLDVRY